MLSTASRKSETTNRRKRIILHLHICKQKFALLMGVDKGWLLGVVPFYIHANGIDF